MVIFVQWPYQNLTLDGIHMGCGIENKIIADGESSLYARIQQDYTLWDKHLKMKCSNHLCKCFRSRLKNITEENIHSKGKDVHQQK